MSAAAGRLHRVRTDAALVRRFRAGDETAFAALHARYAEAIRSYAAYMLRGTADDPDDAAQDVFLRAYQALRRDEREIDVRPWLYRVAHNRCVDGLRRPVTGELDAERAEAGAGDPVAAIERREAMRSLLKDIGGLTDGQRSALLLRELGGLSHEAVAEALGITPTSSRMLVHRARTALVDAAEARDTTCRDVRERLIALADEGGRLARRDRRHLVGCAECKAFRRAHAGVERELSLLAPAGVGLLKVLGGGGAASGAAGAGGAGAGGTAFTAGAGAGVAGAGSGASLLSGKLAVGACCALLASGGAVVGVKEATTGHGGGERGASRSSEAAAPRRAAAPVPTPAATTPAAARPSTSSSTAKRHKATRTRHSSATAPSTTGSTSTPVQGLVVHDTRPQPTAAQVEAARPRVETVPAAAAADRPSDPGASVDLGDLGG